MNLSNLIESLSAYRARSLHTSLNQPEEPDPDISSIDNNPALTPIDQPLTVARGLLQNGATTPPSQQLNSTESFSEAINGNNSITTEEEANETTNIEFRIESKYLHAGRCACFACSYSRDSLETNRESNSELNNTLSNADPTIAFGTLNELSDYLTTGFWEEAGTYTRRFNLGGSGLGAKNGQLTYNITGWADDSNGLSAERQNLTREVFNVYEAITGIEFVEVATEGDFRFTDNDSGAYAYLGGGWYDQDPNTGTIDYNAAIIDYSVINVASSWFYGDSSYNSYTPQTIFHEIGHALGLGHQGQYNAGNGNPTYENSAQYGNDTWLTTMMSYWSQTTNTNVNASRAYLQTPMTVDWIALDKLYGSQGYGSFKAFNGNTVYGVGTNISSGTSEIMNNFATMISDTAYTLVDGSGYDILNVSNYSDDQFINLAPSELNGTLPSSSSIGGLVNNLTIGVGTILEEAIGGSGNDTFLGNIADNVFRGGNGGDRFYDSFGSDTYYGGSGTFDTLYFSENYSDFSIENLGTSLAFSRNNSGLADTDLIWNDIELVYFNDDVIKTYQELLADITPINTPPTANDVFVATSEDSNSVSGNFNANDPDSSDQLTYTITTAPTIGSVVVNSDGTFTYNFGNNFQSLGDGDSTAVVFQYIASDDNATDSAPATVTITINGSNDAPILSGTPSALTNGTEDIAYLLKASDLLQGYSDIDGDTLSITSVTTASANGTLTPNGNGTWTYTPTQDLNGEVVFSFVVSDGNGGTANGSTSLTLDPVEDEVLLDEDNNGIVDGTELTAYQLFSEAGAITLKNNAGQTYNNSSSGNSDVVAAIETDNGFQVLLEGTGSRNDTFYVWNTNSNGVIIGGSGWKSGDIATRLGWEETFNFDTNRDGTIGALILDDDNNGIVDGTELTAYQLFSEAGAITLKNNAGQTYNNSSSGNSDVVAAIETDNGFQVLLEGTGSRNDTFYVWNTNSNGVIIGGSGWKSGDIATRLGWEETFNFDTNRDGTIGALILDDDNNGIVDGTELTAYQLFSEAGAITLKNNAGQTYNNSSSGNSDVVAAIETDNGFQVLLEGTGSRNDTFYVWNTNSNGVITGGSGWKSGDIATRLGWEETFNFDTNRDGTIGALILDDDNNGIVDGTELTAYQLFSEAGAITLKNNAGQTYNNSSSGNSDVVAAIETDNGFQVLLEGTGSRNDTFYVWNTNSNGVITGGSGWKSGDIATRLGWEETFNFDTNRDGTIGALILDDDNNGIVDGTELTAYQLFSEAGAITLKNNAGQTYNNSSSGNSDVVAAIETDNGFQVLLEGTGSRNDTFYVWDTNSNGVITGGSGWKSGNIATRLGWEETFNFDTNRDGTIGLPPSLSSPTLEARFKDQWHLKDSSSGGANVASAWLLKNKSGSNIYGTGIHINVIDDGLDWRHQDLSTNYISASSYDYVGKDNDPTPSSSADHGTAVAGVAAGYGHNGIGITGAAPNANISGQRLLGAGTARNEASALTRTMNAVDIYSNSWGPNDNGRLQAAPARVLAALKDGVTNGRDGKGAIYTWAGGNGRNSNDNSNYDGYANSRYVISVAAMTNRGRYSGYSEPGANVLVSAPSNGGTDAITTTSTNNSYIDNFGGTSSATPLVSGVIALMLEANPNLTWRDVQHVLVNSSDVVDASSNGWFTNGAEHDFSHDYGFGRINAEAAVALAKTWNNVGDEVSYSASTTPGIAIPDAGGGSISSTITISQDITLESVVIPILSDHTYAGDLTITLTSPEGTTAILSEGNRRDTSTLNFNFSAKTFWGESSRGVWTLTINDLASLDTGTLDQWGLNLYGTQGTNFNAAITDSITGNELETFTGASGMTYASKEALEQIEGLSSYLSHIEDLLAESPEKATGDWLIGTQGPQDQIMRASELGISDSMTSQTFNAQNGISSFSMISALDPTEFIAQSLDSLGTNLSYAYPELLHETTTRSLIPSLETSTFKA
ncbi:hypothetical protein WH7805_09564 [Synechococcus sp. WH 7805]|uniref:S8 family serine peptidase n=1 Tax=Synechococcus sp. (strain WH7805) TaxID=59931 RepID=UPI00006B9FB4|nr:S8 family serine peptidase [Synechococcus sp. WH 7805]EAR17767.1 hypothetical protein WH7805_09564 [Synechococcus sp. WH 7805]